MSYPKLQKDLHEVERGYNMQQQQQPQQMRQHPEYPQLQQQEEIPLNRLNSVESAERSRIREIFNHVSQMPTFRLKPNA